MNYHDIMIHFRVNQKIMNHLDYLVKKYNQTSIDDHMYSTSDIIRIAIIKLRNEVEKNGIRH